MGKHCWLALIFFAVALIVAQMVCTGTKGSSGWHLLLGATLAVTAIGVVARRTLLLKGNARIWFGAICSIVAVSSVLGYVRFVPDEFVWRHEIGQGDELVQRIESYRRQHGRAPASLRELFGIYVDGRLSYQRCGANRYIVRFPTTVGEYMSYDSLLHRWQPVDLVCEPPTLLEDRRTEDQER